MVAPPSRAGRYLVLAILALAALVGLARGIVNRWAHGPAAPSTAPP